MAALLPDPGAQGLQQSDSDTLDVTITIPLSVLGLVANGVSTADEYGKTALHWAAQEGHKPLAARLIKSGADLGARTRFHGQTPLHLAAAAGHADLVSLLITPTNLNAQDNDHQTALQLAVQHRQLDAASVLVGGGAALGAQCFVSTPLASAFKSMAEGGPPEMSLLLLKAMVADPSLAGLVEQAVRWTGHEGTALHLTAAAGYQPLVTQLVEAGADKDAVNYTGATPLWAAAAAGHAALVPLLATAANINRATPPYILSGASPLHAAAHKGYVEVVEALLAAGAQPQTRNSDGHTALAVAARETHLGIVLLLLRALVTYCDLHEQQKQPQLQQDQDQQQPSLVAFLAEAVLSVAISDASRCTQLLEVVMAVLGPEVTGEVCQSVQQQLLHEWEHPQAQPAVGLAGIQQRIGAGIQVSYLAEALLLSWLGAVERLHAARRPVVGRLQRLVVPGVGAAGQQIAGPRTFPQCQLTGLVQQAADAAAAGEQQEALRLLGRFAALHLGHVEVKGPLEKHSCGSADPGASKSTPCALPSSCRSACLAVAAGLRMAADTRDGAAGSSSTSAAGDRAAHALAVSLYPAGVYSTFLAAWVEARHQLQELPQEVVTTVLAAVKATQQQQQQQQQQDAREEQ